MLAVINSQMAITAYSGICTNIVLCFTSGKCTNVAYMCFKEERLPVLSRILHFSGLVWPIEAEHQILRSISWVFPLTWTVEAARGICSKNFPFLHPIVLRGFASTIVWNLIFAYVIYFFMKYKKDIWVKHVKN